MSIRLPFLWLLLCLALPPLPDARAQEVTAPGSPRTDSEYEQYKAKGDALYSEGNYPAARKQYENCLEVPGFSADPYAKTQIDKCMVGQSFRQQADDALAEHRKADAITLYRNLLTLNPGDLGAKAQLADLFEREGNVLFSQKRYREARDQYLQALAYAVSRQETLRLQIRICEENLRPKANTLRQAGFKVLAGALAVGAGTYAVLLHTDFQTKQATLSRVAQQADPSGSGIISNADLYRQYNEAYNAAEAARSRNGLYKACLGVATVAVLAEVYLYVHKPRPRTTGWQWRPSADSWGLALHYGF
ncbi:hypothetical protein GCM10027578_21510 [Spirosoma luteolum]